MFSFYKISKAHVVSESEKITMELKNIHFYHSIAVERFFWKGVFVILRLLSIGVMALLCAVLIYVLSFLFTFYIKGVSVG